MLKDIERVLVSEEQIDKITTKIASEITEEYKNSSKKLVLICILKGSLMFCSDLMKKIHIPMEVEFMKVSSYGARSTSSGIINIHLDIKRDDMEDVDFNAVATPVTYQELTKLAIQWSDGVIQDDENVDPALIAYAQSLGKPVLEFNRGSEYADACSEFYNQLCSEAE